MAIALIATPERSGLVRLQLAEPAAAGEAAMPLAVPTAAATRTPAMTARLRKRTGLIRSQRTCRPSKRTTGNISLPLEQPLLGQLLAVHAVRGPRNRDETFLADHGPAVHAVPVRPVVDPAEGLVDLENHGPLAVRQGV